MTLSAKGGIATDVRKRAKKWWAVRMALQLVELLDDDQSSLQGVGGYGTSL